MFVHFEHSHLVKKALADGSQHSIAGRLLNVEQARPRLQLHTGVGKNSNLLHDRDAKDQDPQSICLGYTAYFKPPQALQQAFISCSHCYAPANHLK